MSSETFVAQSMQLLQDVLDGAGAELILFFLAFFMHFALFSKYGVFSRGAKSPRAKKETSSSCTSDSGHTLARSLSSLVNEAQDVKLGLKLTGSESEAAVKKLVAAAGPEMELQIVQAAVRKQRLDVLRRFFASYRYPATATNSSQCVLLKRLVRKGLLAEALECVRTVSSPKPFLYNAVLEALADKKELEAVKQVFGLAKDANVVDANSHNALIKVLAVLGKIDLAKRALRHMQTAGLQPSQASFNPILDAMVKSDLDGCWALLHEMQALGIQPANSTCSIMLKGIQKGSKDRDVQRVLKTIESRAGHEMDDGLLGSLVEALMRSGHVHQMIAYLKKLRQRDSTLQVRCPHTIGSIIRAHGVVEDLDSVWEIWREMKRSDVQPTRIALGCMVEALASNNDAEGAYAIIHEALADPQTKGLVNAVMYSSVLKGLSHQKLFERVWVVYEEMIREKLQFSITTYNALLDVCARSGEIGRAETLIKDMTEQGIQPNIITYGTVIKAYCSANRLDQAFVVMKEMKKDTELRPDEVTYNTLLDGCARYGLFERGLTVLADMRDAKVAPSNYTLSVLAKLANRSKKPEKAFELVEELKNEFGVRLNMHVYNNLIHAAICSSDMVKAQEVFASMLTEKIRPDGRTYTLLLRFCMTQKTAASAAALLRSAAGLAVKEEKHLHPWKAQGQDGLLPTLLVALKQVPSASWAAAPRRGNSALQDELVQEVFDFLVRCPDKVEPGQVSTLLREIQAAMPGLKMDKRLCTKISARQ